MINIRELRIGNILITENGIPQPIGYITDELIGFRNDCGGIDKHQKNPIISFDIDKVEPLPLSEENILQLRQATRPDFKPIAFGQQPPKERQIENNYWSGWINDDYKLHLSPAYDTEWIDGKPVKSKNVKFWFTWLTSGNWFLSLKAIRGKNTLMYVHQLQNLFYELTGDELEFQRSVATVS